MCGRCVCQKRCLWVTVYMPSSGVYLCVCVCALVCVCVCVRVCERDRKPVISPCLGFSLVGITGCSEGVYANDSGAGALIIQLTAQTEFTHVHNDCPSALPRYIQASFDTGEYRC